ncbi:hypothetical protein [Methylobacterium sp. Leaf85]|uniref:hypothetical protein n=1 Tax=Methylobacterium sp. Leaf85 TaxID=1736241 RepID=UPI0006F810B8|nr:hypothetical protein [Methylobacterium sp. Leaf85]KQO49746.1 hypothetical protein ASF08_22900 [Methylobacterium sp. Leaf85]
MATHRELELDQSLHRKIAPLEAYRRFHELHGSWECLYERYGWLTHSHIRALVEAGRALVEGRSRNASRRLTPAEEQGVVNAVFSLGGVSYAAQAAGVTEHLVRKLLRERGHTEWPRASRRPADVAAAKARVAGARRAA